MRLWPFRWRPFASREKWPLVAILTLAALWVSVLFGMQPFAEGTYAVRGADGKLHDPSQGPLVSTSPLPFMAMLCLWLPWRRRVAFWSCGALTFLDSLTQYDSWHNPKEPPEAESWNVHFLGGPLFGGEDRRRELIDIQSTIWPVLSFWVDLVAVALLVWLLWRMRRSLAPVPSSRPAAPRQAPP